MAQNVDIPLSFLRADLVDNSKPRSWLYAYSPSVTAVNGYYVSREAAREAAIHKLAADIESHYKVSATNPAVYDSYTTSFGTGPNCELIFASATAGTAGSATTVAITADSAGTAVLTSATSAGVVTITVIADSGNTITSTANDVVAAVNADTGTTAHAAHWITAALTGKSDGKGVVSLMTAKTLVNEINIHQMKESVLTLTVGLGRK